MFQYVRTAYYLSLIVVAGAVICQRLAGRVADAEPLSWWPTVALGLAVFLIYTLDRLLDIRSSKPKPQTPRHLFHRQHAPALWTAVAVGSVAGLAFIWLLPESVVRFGFWLGMGCAAYLGLVFALPQRHQLLLLKEPLVALLYTVGVWGSVWAQRPAIRWVEGAEAGLFGLIAFQNLLVFGLMESRENRQAYSLTTYWGDRRSGQIVAWLSGIVVGGALVICFTTYERFAQRTALMLALMSVCLYVMNRKIGFFAKKERYRWLGDLVFWLPLLVL